jgi:hypothetical protein
MATPPVSAIAICNLALDHLGEGPIASIDPPESATETICARWYDQTRRSLLREYLWNFSRARAYISRSGTPLFDYADSYTLPNDCLRVIRVGNAEQYYADYEIEEREFLCNAGGATSLKLRYTKDISDVNKFDPLFINILALRLALKMAVKFTLKDAKLDTLAKQLAQEEGFAVAVDGQERPPVRVQNSKLLAARRRGSTSSYASPYTVFE